MNRFVVMVDAGYLLRQSIEMASNRQSRKRADLEITDPAGLIALLIAKAKSLLALDHKELLRVYWYDGVLTNGLTPQQRALVEVDDVQFRAGTINAAKQQKGVDSLIVTDLIELTSHHAICDAVLVTGDSDLAVGIELAQRRGVRIAVLGLEDLATGVAHHQSFEITSRADRVGRIGTADLAGLIRFVPPTTTAPTRHLPGAAQIAPPTAAPVAAPTTQSSNPQVAPPQAIPRAAQRSLTPADEAAILAAVAEFVRQQATLVGALDPNTNRIDAAIDRALIHHVFIALGRGQLTNAEKISARSAFRAQI